jgi:quercetin dioxygenase-like cupin family protein
MSKKQELDIHIAHDGTVTINVLDGKGKSCLDATRDLEESLGAVLQRETKASFYEETDRESVKIREGIQ